MKKGDFTINRFVTIILVLIILVILATLIIKIQSFKDLFVSLLESFK